MLVAILPSIEALWINSVVLETSERFLKIVGPRRREEPCDHTVVLVVDIEKY